MEDNKYGIESMDTGYRPNYESIGVPGVEKVGTRGDVDIYDYPGLKKVSSKGGVDEYEQVLDVENKPIAWQHTRPPGARPTDDQLAQYEEKMKVADYIRGQIGYNPNMNVYDVAKKNTDDIIGKANPLYLVYGAQTQHEMQMYQNVYNNTLNAAIRAQEDKRKEFQGLMKMYENDVTLGYKGQDALYAKSFAQQYGRKPTATELIDFKNKAKNPTLGDQPFSSWDESTKVTSYQDAILTGKDAKFSNRDAESTRLWKKGFMDYMNQSGLTPEIVNSIRSEASSYKKSIDFQQKNRDMINSFVRNIDKQVDKIEGLMTGGDIQRFGIRAADMGVRELKTRLAGSGSERVLESYLREVSNEIAKVVTGSQASVAEVSVEAQKVWSNIHDKNLSFPEIKQVLDATRKQGELRLQAADEAMAESKANQLQLLSKYLNRGKQPQPVQQVGKRDISQGVSYLRSAGSNKEAVKSRIKALAAKGWTREELNEIAKQSGWAK